MHTVRRLHTRASASTPEDTVASALVNNRQQHRMDVLQQHAPLVPFASFAASAARALVNNSRAARVHAHAAASLEARLRQLPRNGASAAL
eukprot:909928-Pleurochrysis_carterae.AAC.1